jgi:hypothetical protein
MNPNNEQLAQCRAEFEAYWDKQWTRFSGSSDNVNERKSIAWDSFQAAWRPRLTKAELRDFVEDVKAGRNSVAIATDDIFRAMGGKDEKEL